ncbi:hypothetical protein [Flavobacterium psychrophilum]|nr:hypothetical protein [Flavobacterium psychrophilum]
MNIPAFLKTIIEYKHLQKILVGLALLLSSFAFYNTLNSSSQV